MFARGWLRGAGPIPTSGTCIAVIPTIAVWVLIYKDQPDKIVRDQLIEGG